MKKAWILVFVFACLFGLVGCDPSTNSIDAEELLRNTEKIELVHYENEHPKLVRLDGKHAPVFDSGKTTTIAVLDDAHMEDVVQDIAQQQLLLWGRTVNEPVGKTLILYQRNGTMLVLFGCVYKNRIGVTKYFGSCNLYSQDGTFMEYLGDIASDYVDILELKYFKSNP